MPSFSLPRSLALTSVLALACCTPPPPQPLPPPVVQPSPTPTPAPQPVVQEPVYDNWLDAPQTPGDWSYQQTSTGSVAQFYRQANQPMLALACNVAQREVQVARPGVASQGIPVRIRTETAERLLTAYPAEDGSQWLIASLRSSDPLLDAMALSRGRFAVETAGLETLYVPAWAEVTRVVEDCR
ncbi:hypothetical protein LY632_06445 [Erythrobacter sp. SDW2]|uniref:hypothetical protein n=1 Tax=Erythrobacter sp. SDW2 TaxID=2907154 RepID=UPI001F41223B|nr:hypothetical protein [Erythrobacter sp. SDW2]UIP08027.1 hypothetical protein LY632_06445 [Erythrobacter sp. SDW2]